MSSKAVSPTASALRASRLFSVPAPLQRADSFNSGLTGTRVSNSATQPWPTQQAITTPTSALARGEWGLKRALPLRSTARTSTPAIKLHAVDTREHITDFDSASDHTRTLAKFQELRLPISRPADSSRIGFKNVFEPQDDHTNPKVPPADPRTGLPTSRWKYAGPDLGRLTESNFQEYLDTKVKSKRDGFMDFLRAKAVAHYEAERVRKARHDGTYEPTDTAIHKVSDAELDGFVRELRTEFGSGSPRSKLAEYMKEFLDIRGSSISDGHIADAMMDTVADSQPPTHPSAGLGYLRTDAILTNNPIFGPQAHVAPQPARTLRQGAANSNPPERIGMAGFIVDTAWRESEERRRENTSRVPAFKPTEEENEAARAEMRASPASAMRSEGLGVKGGTRWWAEARLAQIDPEGRVLIQARAAPERNIVAHTMDPTLGGRYSETEPKDETKELFGRDYLVPGRGANTGDGENYGAFGLNALRDQPRAQPQAQPQSESLGRDAKDMGDEELDGSSIFKNLRRRER